MFLWTITTATPAILADVLPAMSLQPFSWTSLPTMQSCGMQSVTWVSQGISSTSRLIISITNEGVKQLAPPSSSTTYTATPISATALKTQSDRISSRRSVHRRQGDSNWRGYGGSWLLPIDADLVENLDPTSQNWTWPSVNVTQGWYVLTASMAVGDIVENSEPFFVANGTSTFPCLDTDALVHNTSTTSTPLVGAIAGGAAGGAVTLLLCSVLVYNKRRKRRALADTNGILPDPYTVTAAQFPIHRRAAFRRLEDSPEIQPEKQGRQPLRHGPRAAVVSDQTVEQPPFEHDEGAGSQVPRDDHVEVESTEMVSVSMRALQRLLRRVGGAISDLQHPGGSDDAVSSTAPPEYEEVVHQ